MTCVGLLRTLHVTYMYSRHSLCTDHMTLCGILTLFIGFGDKYFNMLQTLFSKTFEDVGLTRTPHVTYMSHQNLTTSTISPSVRW